MRIASFRLGLLALTATIGLSLASMTGAAELQVLQGTPSAKEIEDALAPKSAPTTVRFRGITLGGQKAPQPAPATQAAAPAQPAAKPATPTQATAAVAINITFDFNSDKLTPQGQQVLDNLGRALNSDRLKGNRFLLEGHTDSKGSDAYNMALSERRAKSARDYLVGKHQVDAARIQTVGKGESEPLDPANPERDINRRVQILNLGS
ncbi:MAG: OmpA family protein [Alphaproteobacteria bacterium]|nr:OmpA family protein [Alphaproteobacteria bacterium]